MLDINYIRENIDLVKKAVKDKGVDVDIDELLKVDQERRKLLTNVEDLRRQRNEASQNRDIEKGKAVKEQLDNLERQLDECSEKFHQLSLSVPNIPLDEVPEGGVEDFQLLRTVGKPPELNFIPKDHLELGEKLEIIDVDRAAKVSGSRFAYLKNEGVILELALVKFAMDRLLKEGFSPVIPPVLIKQELTEGLGYWQAGGNENYYLVSDYEELEVSGNHKSNPLYLIGTGEHSVVPMHKDEIFNENELPRKYVAFSPCFRREAGTYGKDTKGILRVHQFDKVEMVAFVKPEDDLEERTRLLNYAEGFLKELDLAHRVIRLARGDLSFPAAETIDIETWIPSQNKYRETHSISTTTDFQARRLNIRYGAKLGSSFILGQSKLGARYVHILNGTALAIGRILIAILENYQQEDGSVKIPDVLIPYTNFSKISPK